MPRLERKINIETTPEKIFEIITDGLITPKWNPTVSAVSPISEEKTQLETDFGTMNIVKAEHDKNKSSTWFMEKSDMNAIGYILTPKKDATEVNIWTEYDDKKLSKLFKKNADLVLTGLKMYAEFIEEGGNPNLYNKSEILATF